MACPTSSSILACNRIASSVSRRSAEAVIDGGVAAGRAGALRRH
jgi:hypothetical protein